MTTPLKVAPKASANQHTIELLETMLADARAGHIEAIVGVSIRHNGNFLTFCSTGLPCTHIVGMLMFAAHDIMEVGGDDR